MTAPQDVSAKIEKDILKIFWDHVELDESFQGYYIIVKDIGLSQNESPEYVHVSSSSRCAKIIGLRPGTSYQIKVNR